MTEQTIIYSCLKAAEGGTPQKEAIEFLTKELGMKVRKAHSPYVGQYGIEATGTKRQHKLAEDFLF